MANVSVITDDNFEAEVLQSDLPFLLDFTAKWCGPCQVIGPIVEEIGKEHENVLRVGAIDIDANPQTPAKFTVMSIPTLILFQGGKIKEQIVGAVPKKVIMEQLKPHLEGK
ncbi:MAG: thioredoxin [Planctomycetota bacterium]|jgi:thioredoxin 1